MIGHIHHVGVVLPDADEALGFYRDTMGLTVTDDVTIEEQGVRGVLLGVGENEIELLQPTRDDTGVARYLDSRGPTLHHICFETDDIEGELERLKAANVDLIDEEPRDGIAGRIAFIHPKASHGVLIELAQTPDGSHVSPEKGFDHLAMTVADYEAAQATWKRLVGLEVVNEISVEGRGMLIGQMPSGQCMVELLAAQDEDSPMAQRIAENGEGPASMVAIEVADIDAEITRYREAGVELPDAAPGPLPNSVTSTISPNQSYGLAIQLVQFA